MDFINKVLMEESASREIEIKRQKREPTGERTKKTYISKKAFHKHPYACDLCEERFSENDQLIEHLKEHLEESRNTEPDDQSEQFYECEICYLAFTDEVTLVEHSKEHSKPNMEGKEEKQGNKNSTFLKCEICSMSIPSIEFLGPHMARMHSGDKSKENNVRPVQGEDIDYLSADLSAQFYECEVCYLSFSNEIDLVEHSKEHSKPNKEKKVQKEETDIPGFLKCKICHLSIPNAKFLGLHMERMHPGEIGKGNDQATPKQPSKEEYPSSNKKKKLPKQETLISGFLKCEICDLSIPNAEFLGIHMAKMHAGEKGKINDQATPKQPSKDYPSSNRKKKLPKQETLITGFLKCEICDLSIPSVEFLGIHMAKMHGGEEGKGNNDTPSAGQDVEDQSPQFYECDICYLAFPDELALVEHSKEHSKPNKKSKLRIQETKNPGLLKCELCNMDIPSMEFLAEHLSRVHSTEKSIDNNVNPVPAFDKDLLSVQCVTCEVCYLAFPDDDTLMEHSKVHAKPNKEKKAQKQQAQFARFLKCEICYMSIPSIEYLGEHMLRMHSGDKSKENNVTPPLEEVFCLFECKVCFLAFDDRKYLITHMKSHTKTKIKDLQDERKQKTKLFECETCCRSFPDEKRLKVHMATHLDNKLSSDEDNSLFECEVCELSFNTEDMLTAHKEIHMDGNMTIESGVYECEICFLSFKKSKHLTEHMKAHEKKKTFSFEEQKARIQALRAKHCCGVCSASFVDSVNLAKHMDVHLKEDRLMNKPDESLPVEVLYCDVCNAPFTENIFLEQHMQTHYEETMTDEGVSKVLTCQICNKTFTELELLVKHMDIHVNKTVKPEEKDYQDEDGINSFVRKICDTSFTDSDQVCDAIEKYLEDDTSKEKNDVHVDVEMPDICVCEICDSQFSDIKLLTEHYKSHLEEITPTGKAEVLSEPVPNEFVCKICNASFAKKNNLTKHSKIHLELKPYKCGICDTQCTTKSNMTAHLMIHTGEKPFICDICDAAFSKRCNLVKHQCIHTGEKQFKCFFCEEGFSSRTNLNAHMRLHTGDKPYKCETCDATFLVEAKLIKHQQMHTGERPFVNKAGLDKHIKSQVHTGDDQPYKCDYCNLELTSQVQLANHLKTHTEENQFKCDSQKGALAVHMKVPAKQDDNNTYDDAINQYHKNILEGIGWTEGEEGEKDKVDWSLFNMEESKEEIPKIEVEDNTKGKKEKKKRKKKDNGTDIDTSTTVSEKKKKKVASKSELNDNPNQEAEISQNGSYFNEQNDKKEKNAIKTKDVTPKQPSKRGRKKKTPKSLFDENHAFGIGQSENTDTTSRKLTGSVENEAMDYEDNSGIHQNNSKDYKETEQVDSKLICKETPKENIDALQYTSLKDHTHKMPESQQTTGLSSHQHMGEDSMEKSQTNSELSTSMCHDKNFVSSRNIEMNPTGTVITQSGDNKTSIAGPQNFSKDLDETHQSNAIVNTTIGQSHSTSLVQNQESKETRPAKPYSFGISQHQNKELIDNQPLHIYGESYGQSQKQNLNVYDAREMNFKVKEENIGSENGSSAGNSKVQDSWQIHSEKSPFTNYDNHFSRNMYSQPMNMTELMKMSPAANPTLGYMDSPGGYPAFGMTDWRKLTPHGVGQMMGYQSRNLDEWRRMDSMWRMASMHQTATSTSGDRPSENNSIVDNDVKKVKSETSHTVGNNQDERFDKSHQHQNIDVHDMRKMNTEFTQLNPPMDKGYQYSDRMGMTGVTPHHSLNLNNWSNMNKDSHQSTSANERINNEVRKPETEPIRSLGVEDRKSIFMDYVQRYGINPFDNPAMMMNVPGNAAHGRLPQNADMTQTVPNKDGARVPQGPGEHERDAAMYLGPYGLPNPYGHFMYKQN